MALVGTIVVHLLFTLLSLHFVSPLLLLICESVVLTAASHTWKLTANYQWASRRCQDTSDPRHFGTGAEMSYGHFGTSAELSGHICTSAEVS